jgi:hypothetical protein|tara:strand:+ start:50690 stop:50998 length:309 start_codon:yes stop_codon:yes gene_type:complete
MDPDEEEKVDGIPSLSSEELEELTEELKHTEESAILEPSKKKNFDMLSNILSEYLDSFIILGYTAEGDEVVFNKMITPRDSRSLQSLLDEISHSPFLDDPDE